MKSSLSGRYAALPLGLLAGVFLAFLHISSTEAQVISCTPTDVGLTAYWKFDEGTGTGTTAQDSTVYNNSGSLRGLATFTASGAQLGFSNPRALSLDGSGSYVLVSDTTGLPALAQPRTVSFWMNQSARTSQATVVSMGNGDAPGQKFIVQMNQVGAEFYLFTDGVNACNNITLTGSQIPSTGTWHHVAFAFDGTNWQYYLDGTRRGSGT